MFKLQGLKRIHKSSILLVVKCVKSLHKIYFIDEILSRFKRQNDVQQNVMSDSSLCVCCECVCTKWNNLNRVGLFDGKVIKSVGGGGGGAILVFNLQLFLLLPPCPSIFDGRPNHLAASNPVPHTQTNTPV